ncbi:hypothetical protein ABEF93_006490 [Exophiala dermatitidis]
MDTVRFSGAEDHVASQGQKLESDLVPLTNDHGPEAAIETADGSESSEPELEPQDLHDEDIVGVSISRAQTHMRAPETEIVEKARALNLPLESFNHILTSTEEQNESDDQQEAEAVDDGSKPVPRFLDGERSASPDKLVECQDNTLSSTDSLVSDEQEINEGQAEYATPTSGRRALGKVERRQNGDAEPLRVGVSRPVPPQDRLENEVGVPAKGESQNLLSQGRSIARAFLATAENNRRGRSSSGPTAVFSSIRKMLPDLPSPSFNRSSISLLPFGSKNASNADRVDQPDSPSSPVGRPTRFRWLLQEPAEAQESEKVSSTTTGSDRLVRPATPPQRPDGKDLSLLSPISPAPTLGRPRSNSESSIYLMKKVTGASTYDDINAFADVTEMANSRFKAITDSFQNSSLRLPRLPIIRPIPKLRHSPEEGHMDAIISDSEGQAHITKKQAPTIQAETAQQRAHPILHRALSKTTGDIVVLGGYRGSILRSAQPPHRQLWVPLKVGFNLRKVDLEVGLTREDELKMEETVIPGGILSHIGPIDICRRLLRHMRKCPNARANQLRVHEWGYDWRLSPDLLSSRLIKFLESLECNQPDTPPEKRGATVIAHSLGGLITRHAVNLRPDLFAGVVYAGVPQHCVNILGPLRNGDDVLLSSRVLTAQVNFTFRTSFALLPEDGRCFLQKQTNERYDLDFFNPKVWDEYRLSPCVNPPLHRHHRHPERRKTLMGALSETIIASSSKRAGAGAGAGAGGGGGGSGSGGSGRGDGNGGNISHQQTMLSTANANQRLAEAIRAVEDPGEEVVGPTMKQSQQSQSSQHRPSVATACTIPKDAAMEYLGRTLREVRTFKQQLKFNPAYQDGNLYPPHGFIFGKTVPTVYGARVTNKEAIKYDDAYDDLAFAAGDGVVLASAAQLPEGYRCVKGGRVESARGHVGLLGDLEGVGRCLEAVVDARAKGVGLGRDGLQRKGGHGHTQA